MNMATQRLIDQWANAMVFPMPAYGTEQRHLLAGLNLTERQRLLFCAACCRATGNAVVMEAADAIERYATEPHEPGLEGVSAPLRPFAAEPDRWDEVQTLFRCLTWMEGVHDGAAICAMDVIRFATDRQAAQRQQGRLLAGIVAPGWGCSPAWRTDTAATLASQMYDARDFSAMPILADAIQDAGCGDYDWLAVMRDRSWPWCRGGRVIDDVRK